MSTNRVIYSTCSLEPEENEAVVAEVLAQANGWRQLSVRDVLHDLAEEGRLTAQAHEALKNAVAPDGALTILPGMFGQDVQTDGFFIAVLKRE